MRRRKPVVNDGLINPKGEASTLGKGSVILRPVTDAVLRFGGFVLHKMRLPDGLHP